MLVMAYEVKTRGEKLVMAILPGVTPGMPLFSTASHRVTL